MKEDLAGDAPVPTAEIPSEPWVREGTTVYALYHTGEYDFKDGKATPKMVNRFSLQVQHMQGWNRDGRYGCTPEQAIAIAQLIEVAPELLEALTNAHALIDAFARVEGKYQSDALAQRDEEAMSHLCINAKRLTTEIAAAISKATQSGSPR